MYTNQQKRSQPWTIILLSIFVTLSLGLFLHCLDDNPADHGDKLPTDIVLSIAPVVSDSSDHTFFVGESIAVCIEVLEIEPIDTIVLGIIRNPDSNSNKESGIKAAVDTMLLRGAISFKNYTTIYLNQPGNYLLGVYARSQDTIDIDTLYITVVEDGKNVAPVVHLTPIRSYAAPSLPCSLKVSFSNPESWQSVKLLPDSMESNISCISDSLCIWKPSTGDTSKTHIIRVVAIDNGKPPKRADASVRVAVITDNQNPKPPQNVQYVKYAENIVKLVWNADSLTDEYSILRSRSGEGTTWDTIGKTTLPEFTDTTTTVFLYRVVAHNYFGAAASGNDIISRDTVHYAHVISFEKEQSIASENDSVRTFRVQVSQAAKMPITVLMSLQNFNAKNDDYTLLTKNVIIEKGSTTANVTLRIHDDDTAETPESLSVSIDSVSSGYRAGILHHTITITDNDTFYTVTYNRNGAEEGIVPQDSGNYKRGAKVTVQGNAGTLQRIGYTFTGWNTQSDGKGPGYNAGAILTIAGEKVTLFAQWALQKYTITFNGNGGSAGTAPAGTTCFYGSNFTIPKNPGNLSKAGYTFKEWYANVNGNPVIYSFDTVITMGAADLELFARWVINKYTVTCFGNGNSSGNEPAPFDVAFGDSVTVPGCSTLVKTGYTFTGWNTGTNDSGTVYAAGTKFIMPASGVSLYAKWLKNSYTVTYDGNGQSSGSPPATSTIAYLDSVKIYGNNGNLEKIGNEILCWNSKPDGTGTKYPADTVIQMGPENLTLYAQWVPRKYKITFDGNGSISGTPPADTACFFGATFTLQGNTGNLTKTGCTFLGWDTVANGNSIVSQIFKMGAENLGFFAKWAVNSQTVTCFGNGNSSGNAPDSLNVTFGDSVTVPGSGSLIKTGYIFTGWNTLPDGTGTSFIAGSKFVMSAAPVLLYAQWSIKTYTVTYNGNGYAGGTPPPTTNHLYNATVTVSGAGSLSKTGHSFFGWNTTVDGSGVDYIAGATFTKSTKDDTLYARWTANVYNITFNTNGDGVTGSMSAQPLVFGTSATLASNGFTRTGYTFAGWAISAGGNVVYVNGANYTMATEGAVLYVKWTPNVCKVAFNSQGGSMVDSQVVNYNDTARTPSVPTKIGCTFGGWYKEAACTNQWTFATDKVTGNVSLYTKWTINRYKVIFNSQGGSAVDSQMVNYNVTARTPSAPTKTGYTFGGWYKEAACTNQWTFATDKVTGNVTLYAKWQINTYRVSFEANGASSGSVPTAADYTYGAIVIVSSNAGKLVKGSASFTGWNTQADGNGTNYACGGTFTMGAGPLTLYAKYSNNTVMDNDGNLYTTVKIGNQVWMVENLKTTTYNDGTLIPNVTDSAVWINLTTPGYCWYNNNISYKESFGAVYNGYSASMGKLAPAGWHIPSNAEWDTLQNYLIANGYNYDNSTTSNMIAKSMAAKTSWSSSTNTGAIGNDLTLNNRSGFSALPVGYRELDGTFRNIIGNYGLWWSASESDVSHAYYRLLRYDWSNFFNSSPSKIVGMSVRCLRN
jgi:uncharacterized protein (TIGR02145 family)/uncharacterized repeat protein (TIGR02543 family)